MNALLFAGEISVLLLVKNTHSGTAEASELWGGWGGGGADTFFKWIGGHAVPILLL